MHESLVILCNQNVTNMPRYREPYTVFPRKLPSGKTVFYYRTYTLDGERTVAHSTGKANKTQAKNYCAELLAKGLLQSNTGMNFGVYAEGFFDDNSQWLADKIQSSNGKPQPVAKNTLKMYRHVNKDYLLPFFSKIKLCDLKPFHIKKFRAFMLDKNLSNSTINLSCVCLKIIVSYAIADRLMTNNPFTSINQMFIDARTKDSFSLQQLKEIFHKEWTSKIRFVFCLTGAVTGMRISEIKAIRDETVHNDYIDVADQMYEYGVYVPVKDGEKRKVCICPELYSLIRDCIRLNKGVAFEENQDTYRQEFHSKYSKSSKERVQLGLSFHSMRHFVNTYLISNGIPEIIVKSVLGHSSGKGSMTERYANFKIEDYKEVIKLQQKLMKEFGAL